MSPKDATIQARLLLESLPEHSLGLTTPDLVRLGADLWVISKLAGAALDSLKERLRTRVPSTPGQHFLNGPGASCMVTVPDPQPVLRKEVDLGLLQTALGEDFGALFEVTVTVTPREGFEETLQGVREPGRVQVVLAAIDLVTHKARVSFQSKGAQDLGTRP